MTRADLEQRLMQLAVEIERARTAIWIAEQERETLRHELRRALQADSGKGAP